MHKKSASTGKIHPPEGDEFVSEEIDPQYLNPDGTMNVPPGSLVAMFNPLIAKGRRSSKSGGAGRVPKKDRVTDDPNAPHIMSVKVFVKDRTTLPTKMSDEAKEFLEECGFSFVGPLTHNRLLQEVVFPDGWEKRPTRRSTLTHLVDGKGKPWANIRYQPSRNYADAYLELLPK